MVETRKKIMLAKAHVTMLAKAHNITEAAVWGALSYRSMSPLAQTIRKQAMEEHGGQMVEIPVMN